MSNPDPVKARELVERISNCRHACGCPTCQKNHHLMREAADMIEELSKFLPPKPKPPTPVEIMEGELIYFGFDDKDGGRSRQQIAACMIAKLRNCYEIVLRDSQGAGLKASPEFPEPDDETIEAMWRAYWPNKSSDPVHPDSLGYMRRAVAVLKQRWEAQQK